MSRDSPQVSIERSLRTSYFRQVAVNGEPGVAVFYKGQLFAVLTIRTDGARILDVFAILNPDKLRAVRFYPLTVTTDGSHRLWFESTNQRSKP